VTANQVAPREEPITEPVEQWTGPAVTALAIYCSDGRFRGLTEQMIHDGLKIPHSDLFVVPGGPGWLSLAMYNHKECDVASRWVDTLIRIHNLTRIVLVAHEDCAFYKEKCADATPLEIQQHQVADLQAARDRIVRLGHSVEVELYYADIVNTRVQFKRVP
jgi:hypothetical protein